MKEKNVLQYEKFVYELRELTALLYFVCTSDELEEYERDALGGIYGRLEAVKDGVTELFAVATKMQRELNQLNDERG